MLKVRRALVTGGAGFIGSHIVDRLIREDCEVVVFDDLSTGKLQNLRDSHRSTKLKIVEGDVRDPKMAKDALKDVDVVFHEAAIVSVSRSISEPRVVNDVNVRGTLNLLKSAVNEGVEKFVFASSAAVYGNAKGVSIPEETKPSPVSPYGLGKLRAEEHCFEFHRDYNLATTVLRYFNVYGPGSSSGEYSGVISKFAQRLYGGRPLVIYGSGRQTRDFIHVNDVVSANIIAATKKVSAGEVFNVGSGNGVSIERLAMLEARMVLGRERRPRLVHEPPRPGDIERSCADISKIRRVLRFNPRITLAKGLADLLGESPRLQDSPRT